MKRVTLALLLALNLLAFGPGCSGSDGGGGSPDSGSPPPPPPPLPTGPLWTMLETQMTLNRESSDRVRASLLDKEMITVVICGAGSPLPVTPDAQSCTAVFVNGQFLLFDAGDGAQRSMERLNLPMADLNAMFLTHYHNDHMADVGEVIQRSWVLGRRHELSVYGGDGLDQLLGGFIGAYKVDNHVRMDHHGDDFLPAQFSGPVSKPFGVTEGKSVVVYDKDGVVVTAFNVSHPPVKPAVGYTVTFAGKKIVVSGDTTDTAMLHQQSEGADVLVSEVMNKQVVAGMEAISAKHGWTRNATIYRDIREYHIDVNEVGTLAQASGVKTLVLTHAIPSTTVASMMDTWYALPIRTHYNGKLLIARDGTMVKLRKSTPAGGHKIVTEKYDSGALRSETSYLGDVKDGTSLTWYESGGLSSQIAWTMGSGVAVYYDKNGALLQPTIHPDYSGKAFNLSTAKALIITTSVDTMGSSGQKTGVFASEMTAPYYEFAGAGMDVDIASIQGGQVPIDPLSFLPQIVSKYDQQYLRDKVFLGKTANSLKIDDVDFTQYDVIFLAGGWGAAYDLGYSEVLGQKITAAYQAGIPLGAVCHGSLGFLKAKDASGKSLVQGRRITGVTDKQVKELGIEITPQHPESELKKAGAIFESVTTTQDFFANYVVADGLVVTGQNQNAGAEVAHRLMELVEKKKTP